MSAELAAGRPLFGSRFTLFADCLLLGVQTFVAALPLVTAFAAVTAACQVLGARVDRDASVGYFRAFGAVLRSHVGVTLVPLLLLIDVLAVASGAPGAFPLAAVLAVLVVVGLRAAALWAPGLRWSSVLSNAARQAGRDPGGSLLLLGAVAAAAALVSLVPLTVALMPGVLALAPVAIARRRPAR